ncbi:MAG: hypothetical protein KAG53_09235 [Endozoicomonadaceae bacterium]|nr:hypothetical protein [Endozoicomonadaceae bacterium]
MDMNDSFSVKLEGFKDYMLAVDFKKSQGTNSLFAYLLSLPMLFCGLTVTVSNVDEGIMQVDGLYDRLWSKKIENRKIEVVNQSGVCLGDIEKNGNTGCRRHEFHFDNKETVTLVEGNMIDILKNTKKQLTNNQIIISGPELLDKPKIYSKTAFHALESELRKIKDEKGNEFVLREAMANKASKGDGVVAVDIPWPNDLNLKRVIIPATPKGCNHSDLMNIYERAFSMIEDKKTAPPYNACFLIPMGTANLSSQVGPEVCANWVEHFHRNATPATIVCYDGKNKQSGSNRQLFDQVKTAIEGAIEKNLNDFNSENEFYFDSKEKGQEQEQEFYDANESGDDGDYSKNEFDDSDNRSYDSGNEFNDSINRNYYPDESDEKTDPIGYNQDQSYRQNQDVQGQPGYQVNENPRSIETAETGHCIAKDVSGKISQDFNVKTQILGVSTGENFSPVYNKKSSSNNLVMTSVNAGGPEGYIGGSGINRQFEVTFGEGISGYSVYKHEESHSDLIAKATPNDITSTNTLRHPELLQCATVYHDSLAEINDTSGTVGTVIISAFTDEALPFGNSENRAMSYVYPPKLSNFLAKNCTDMDEIKVGESKFLDAVKKTACNLIVATEEFNAAHGTDNPKLKLSAIRMTFFSAGIFRGHLKPLEVILAVNKGIIEGLKMTSNKRTIELIQFPVDTESLWEHHFVK